MHTLLLIVVAWVVTLNGLLAALQIGLLRRRKPWPRFLAVGICVWAALMVGIGVLDLCAPVDWRPFLRRWFYFPIAVQMIWNVLFIQVLVLLGILVTLGVRLRRPVRPADPAPSPDDLSRRKFVYLVACGAAPATALGMGVHGALSRHELRVRELRVPVAGLPPELEGLTIAHVSDLHSGIFCGPARLKIIREAANDLKADLVTVTGDIINDSMTEFPDGIAAVRGIQSRYGTFACEGNHDLIPGRARFARACAENHLPLLINQTVIVPVRGRRLIIGGLPWMKHGTPDMVDRLFPARQEGDVRLLLVHHPNLFDAASSADLVLSGHTHGGQLMAGPIGLGPLFFKYWSGPYRRGNTALVVSNGCGDWFPCRIGAPAEIGLLRLTAQA